MRQPQPLQPKPSAPALEAAGGLAAAYGEQALAGAKAAFRHASMSGDAAAIELWAEICALLATERF